MIFHLLKKVFYGLQRMWSLQKKKSLDSGSKIVSFSHELLHSSFLFTNISGSIPTCVTENLFH